MSRLKGFRRTLQHSYGRQIARIRKSDCTVSGSPLTFVTQMQALAPAQRDTVLRVVAAHRSRPGPLIEILHAVQTELGFVPAGAVPVIAEELNLSRAEVHGVVTFYHYFRQHQPGRQVVRVCQTE